MGRIGEVEEVARLVAFLACTEANYLNGANFPIDGSYSNTSYIPKLGWYANVSIVVVFIM